MIESLRLKGFRRYQDERFVFARGVNFIEGPNNAGKTTLLYAIEYALFGRVDGFSSPIGLLSPGAKGLGVELVFRGLDGKRYRLQRIHVLPPKARTKVVGHFTLKRIEEAEGDAEPQETYLLSSDFQDHEDALALKLSALLGVRRRAFDVAVNLRQGRITNVLEGAPDLDTVLGVTASVLAAEEMRGMALEREKEASGLPALEQALLRLERDKDGYQERLSTLEHEARGLDEKEAALAETEAQLEQRRAHTRPLETARDALEAAIEAQEQAARRRAEQSALVDEAVREAGDEGAAGEAERELGDRQAEREAGRRALAEERERLETDKSALEQRRGDLAGRIARRRSLVEGGAAACETCGQPIDAAHNRREIAAWEEELSGVEAKLAQLVASLASRREELERGEKERAEIEHALRDLARHKDRLRSLRDALARGEEQERSAEAAVARAIATLRTAAAGASPSRFDTLASDEPNKAEAILASCDEALARAREEVQEEAIRTRVLREALQERRDRTEEELASLREQAGGVEKELAGLRVKVESLKERARTAERLRKLAAGFKELQIALRDKASDALAKDTLAFHQALAEPSREYKSLSIDPARYTVQVTPTDIGKEVPAHLYQGGGHKLLLGLAFKLAVARVVGPCPFLLLDEPTYGLDEQHRASLLNRISQLGVAEQMLLITHHELGDVAGHRLRVVKKGKRSIHEAPPLPEACPTDSVERRRGEAPTSRGTRPESCPRDASPGELARPEETAVREPMPTASLEEVS